MNALPDFATMSAEERADILKQRRNIAIRIPKSLIKVPDLSKCEHSPLMPTHVEIAPTPIALEDKAAAQILVHAPAGLEGAWQRLFIMTYREGGRVFYRNIDADSIEAFFDFNNPRA
jgi:hypothetical protein